MFPNRRLWDRIVSLFRYNFPTDTVAVKVKAVRIQEDTDGFEKLCDYLGRKKV